MNTFIYRQPILLDIICANLTGARAAQRAIPITMKHFYGIMVGNPMPHALFFSLFLFPHQVNLITYGETLEDDSVQSQYVW
jgi:hypothetical protein